MVWFRNSASGRYIQSSLIGVAIIRVNDPNARLQALWQVCQQLPKVNYANLCYLVKFLGKLTASSDSNKMSSQNLAIAMAPSLIWCPNTNDDNVGLKMTAANLHSVIIDCLVNYCDWFFPGGK